MKRLYVGCRVRVVRPDGGSAKRGLVAGDVGVIARRGTYVDYCLTIDGKTSPTNAFGQFPVFSCEIEPILYDGNELVSWESMKGLWTPEGLVA